MRGAEARNAGHGTEIPEVDKVDTMIRAGVAGTAGPEMVEEKLRPHQQA
jgi:hypothetical protein